MAWDQLPLLFCAGISSGLAGALATLLFNRRKTTAETQHILVQTQHMIIDDLRKELESLRKRMDNHGEKEKSYLELIAGLTKEKSDLRVQVDKLKDEHRQCFANEQELRKEVDELKKRIK